MKMPEKLNKLTDEDLARLYQERADEKCIGELYRRYAHLTYGVCLKFLRNQEDAKDMQIQVFEHLMGSLKKANVENFNNWLFIATKNLCLRKLQKEQKTAQKQEIWEKSEKKADFFMENERSWYLNNEEEDKLDVILEIMQDLEEQQRKCLQLFYWEKKRYKEIAALTNYTEKQVKSFLQNGKRNLKKLLLESGYKA